jgi:hypothetical protein
LTQALQQGGTGLRGNGDSYDGRRRREYDKDEKFAVVAAAAGLKSVALHKLSIFPDIYWNHS